MIETDDRNGQERPTRADSVRVFDGQAESDGRPEMDSDATDIQCILRIENLTQRVRAAGIGAFPFGDDCLYDAFFDALCRGLHRQTPRHLLLVRERGVGERSVLIGLAQKGIDGTPSFLKEKQILLGDCRYLPSRELLAVTEALFAAVGGRQELILCLDGFARLFRSIGPDDHRTAILAGLMRLRCRIIGIVSPHEHEELFVSDADARDAFCVVPLHEPDVPIACNLTRHFAAGLCSEYDVAIEDAAVTSAVTLSDRYVLNERLPLKAVKVLRSICDDVAYDRAEHGSTRAAIVPDDVLAKVASLSGVPAQTLSGIGERVDYVSGLADLVVGQDHAIREVANELGLIKAGLVDSGKPASVMLLVGQTGTGKTELAKALARFYSPSKRLKTFTLGNFSEPHSVSGIIGVPPGYVGHDQGGRLVNELNADPYSVFLLDEADKAHPDVMQPFLNLFDEGWVYDQRGVKAYADRAIFILTTNVGQRQIADMCKQGKTIEEITWTMKESLSRIRHTKSNRPVFTPEFLARIKRVIVFKSLDAQAMLGICRKLVESLRQDWRSKRQKTLRIDDCLIEAIAEQAFAADEKSQGKEGGRIVRKILADAVESNVQRAIGERPEAYRAAHAVSVGLPPRPSADSAESASIERPLTERVIVTFQAKQDEVPPASTGHPAS